MAIEVTVDHRWDRMLMKEFKSSGTIKGYPQAGPPIQWLRLGDGGVEMLMQCSIGNEFEYE